MNASISHAAIAGRMAEQSDTLATLAKDPGAFAAIFAAFDSRDPDAFRWVIDRVGLLPRCELVCEWVRIKLGVLRCAEICGPPVEEWELPTIGEFAHAIVRLASNERLLRRVVDAVTCGDPDDYREAIAELELERFCHLICRWVYTVTYDRVCEAVCTPQRVFLPDPVADIRAAARTLDEVVRHEGLFDTIARGVEALNAEVVRGGLERAGLELDCVIVCRLICVWRGAWLCRVFCERPSPVLGGVLAIDEARAFALAAGKLAGQPRALSELVHAAAVRDIKAYEAVVDRFGLAIYCEQVCAWVASLVCSEFCFLICRPPELVAWFTSIGVYQYDSQIDSALPATGLTAGDTRAFFGNMRLNGVLPQTLGGQPLEYRFEYQPIAMASTTLAGAVAAADTTIKVSGVGGFPTTTPFNIVVGGQAGAYEIMTVTAAPTTTWTVTRGVLGTTAAPASAGAAVTTATAASGGWQPVEPGQIARTVIGTWERLTGTIPPVETKDFTVNGIPGPNEMVTTFTADGWIQVPQMNDPASAAGAFSSNGNMISLISSSLAPFLAADETGVSAGNPINGPAPTDLYFGLRLKVRQAGSATDSDGGTCAVVAIDNTLYNNIDQHPEWAGGPISNQLGVYMVDIQELQSAGCADISDSLTVLFTAAHPNLGPVSIEMQGPGGPYGFTLPKVPATGDWYGAASLNLPAGKTVGDLTACAYLVTLTVNLRLTDGDNVPGVLQDQFAFCKSGAD